MDVHILYFTYRISGVMISAASESDGSLLHSGTKPDETRVIRSTNFIYITSILN